MAYNFPPITLLNRTEENMKYSRDELSGMAQKITFVMEEFDIYAQVTDVRVTPLSVCFEVVPEPGSSIKNLKRMKADLELHLGTDIEIFNTYNSESSITIVALPKERPLVGLRNLLESDEFLNAESPLTVVTGINYHGDVVLADIEQLPHMLIAGSTGSGKTVFLDDIIMSILYKASPEDVRIFMVDPKIVDLTYYSGIPHLLTPVLYKEFEVFGMFGWIEDEMMKRYNRMSEVGCKNIQAYMEKTGEKIPQILVIIDEYAELMNDYKKDIEEIVDRLGRLGRSAGVHLIIATQRPTSDIITGSIKSNLPCRASFAVVDSRESNAIINKAGAQKLLGSGDMLFSMSSTAGTEHAQAPFVSEKEIKDVVSYVIKNNPQYCG